MPHQMKNKNNNRKGFVEKYNHEGKFTSLLFISVQRAESLQSESTKYLKFLDLPQNGFRHKRYILWIQSRSWIVNLNEANYFLRKHALKYWVACAVLAGFWKARGWVAGYRELGKGGKVVRK